MTTQSVPGHGRADRGPAAVIGERRQLINLAYRLLGSLAEAEDAVQEAYARWYALTAPQQDAIASPGAWLTTVASRICLTLLGSARARRERYVGAWIPEPLPASAAWITGQAGGAAAGPADPADRITLDESVTMAFLVVLEAVTPAERVALILHDVFGYPFAEVAQIVGRTPAACRQLAWAARDIDALIGLLDPDATLTGDGGGRVPAAPRPVEGGEQIARYLADLARAAHG